MAVQICFKVCFPGNVVDILPRTASWTRFVIKHTKCMSVSKGGDTGFTEATIVFMLLSHSLICIYIRETDCAIRFQRQLAGSQLI